MNFNLLQENLLMSSYDARDDSIKIHILKFLI